MQPLSTNPVPASAIARVRRVLVERGAPRLLAIGTCLGLLGPLAGCPSPDAQGKYDAFLDDSKEERDDAANIKLDQGGALADINGEFLLSLAAVIEPATPLQFYTTVVFTPVGQGGTVSLNLQPLSLDQGETTTPRQPVGDLLELGPVDVTAAGSFELPIAEPVMVTGAANPITGGDIVATLNLSAAIQGEDIFCGTVTGMVTAPLMLDLLGSTFAAVRVTGLDALPADPIPTVCPAGGAEESGGEGSSSEGGSGG